MAFIEFEPGEKFAKKDGDVSEDLSIFEDAGYLLNDNDLIVDIDVLPKKTIERLLLVFKINTQIVWTTRGAHLYFKKPQGWTRAQGVCALGFKVEYKHIKNTKAITVKLNGKAREVDNNGIREPLPWFLRTNKLYKDLLGYEDGDGRNNALYALKRAIGIESGWDTVLRFINSDIFGTPLESNEMELITRTEIIPYAEKGNEYAIAEYLIKQLDFLEHGGKFYFKPSANEEYIEDERLLKQIIYKLCEGNPTRYVDEVKKQMQYRCRKVPHDTIFKIKLKNGYLKDGEFYPIIVDEFTPYSLDVEYNPSAKRVEIVDNYINHLTGSEDNYKNLLLEVLGHTLIVDPEFKRLLRKFFIFVGDGGNGKGTLLQIIKSILGSKNVTGMGIQELTDERYLVTIKGKLANLGDDLTDGVIKDKEMKILKNITTCDYISTRELYKQAESMYFTSSLIFTSNHLLKSFEKGKSFKTRILWLPMYTQVDEKNRDPLFITKLTTKEAIEYWIRLIVEGYMRLYKNKNFTKSDKVEQFNLSYHEENNPYLLYLQDMSKDDLVGLDLKSVYEDCKNWCEDNEIEFSQKMFRETVKEIFKLDTNGVKKINGKATKVFKEID